ncbi:MAG: glgX [Comamonadaceae bacterium]|nr:MAG: glgX [Comamonadaceae bacterium]
MLLFLRPSRNDRFRDGMRCFWIQSAASPHTPVSNCTRGGFAMRLCGSSDVYQPSRRTPAKSLNYVVSHDGFTLRDLVSYNQRHNLANGEYNRDGTSDNLSFNCGAEGPSDDPVIQALRQKLQRALLATTLLAQGTPMICAGDEIGHTQGGNNNPYCQDNTITWINWLAADNDLLAFTQHVLRLRHQLQPFHNQWYSGIADIDGVYDLSWWQADGSVLQGDAWHHPLTRTLACLVGHPGRSLLPLLLLVNPEASDAEFVLPRGQWQGLLDTAHPRGESRHQGQGASHLTVAANSMLLLQQTASHTPQTMEQTSL